MASVSSAPTGKGGSQDFELNLASIIDCMTVLITFLLASASFMTIGVLDAGVAAAGKETTPASPPPIQIQVELKPEHALTLKVTGKLTQTETLPPAGVEIDASGLASRLEALKAKFPDAQAITISGADTTEYRDVIKAMETARKSHPAVMLGGF